ncbi:hypothetical protein IV417_14215 [Alphaproteobacteria bacterium KMM 3653]|uniref:Uncharacterized protein n=1 Tax=Harenicola maris TaxID=2841044 RepID=A0AAP2G4Q5_9RHOB|nr:hypothetical protein [Harenicola maris]
MRLIKLLVVFCLIGGAAFVTKPGAERLTGLMHAHVVDKIVTADADVSSNAALAVMKVTCTLDRGACAELVAAGIKPQIEDLKLARLASAQIDSSTLRCLGVFTTGFCWGF